MVIGWMVDREFKHLVFDLQRAACGKQATGWSATDGTPCPDCLATLHGWLDGAFDG